MKSLIFLTLVLAHGINNCYEVWASSEEAHNSEYREAQSNRYAQFEAKSSTPRGNRVCLPTELLKYIIKTIPVSSPIWSVSKGSETYTLVEFVRSGRLCQWRGRHLWSDDNGYWGVCSDVFNTPSCLICHRCRRRVKTTKEVEEWEK